MPDASRKPPSDPNELATTIATKATGSPTPKKPAKQKKNPAAVALGRLGVKKGGPARAKKLSAEKRTEIARLASQARWHRTED